MEGREQVVRGRSFPVPESPLRVDRGSCQLSRVSLPEALSEQLGPPLVCPLVFLIVLAPPTPGPGNSYNGKERGSPEGRLRVLALGPTRLCSPGAEGGFPGEGSRHPCSPAQGREGRAPRA